MNDDEWATAEVAAHLGINPRKVAQTLARWGVQPLPHLRPAGPRGSTRVYRAADVIQAKANAPGRGNRTRKDTDMTVTTSYGTWVNHGGGTAMTVEDTVAVALGDHANDYDLDAVIADYRDAINDALPAGVTLNGNDFYGPYPADQDFDGYPTTEDGALDIAAIVAGVDFWAIVAKHDTAT